MDARTVTSVDVPGRTAWSFAPRLAVWLAVTTHFTAMVILFSLEFGRLLIGPYYDDLSYFLDAIVRLRVFDESGAWGWVREWIHRPPHSPSSTVLAALSYATLGTHDWAPYVANGLVVLVLLLGVDWLQPGASMKQRLLLAVFVLAVPLAQIAVRDFRPDVLSGVCTALGVLVLLNRPPEPHDLTRRWVTGGLFAAALLSKTSTCVYTLYMCGVALATDALVARLVCRWPWHRILHPRIWGTVLLPIVILAGPHYAFAYRHVYAYIHEVLAGEARALWRGPDSPLGKARYFIDGDGGRWLLGDHVWIFVVVLLGGSLAVLARRQRAATIRWAALAGVTFAAYVVPTINPFKNSFVGATFQSLLLFGTVMVLHEAFRLHGQIGRAGTPVAVAACGVVLVAVSMARGHAQVGEASTDWVVVQNRLERQLVDCIVSRATTHPPHVYVTSVGWTSADLLNFRGLTTGRHIDAGSLHLSRDPGAHRRAMQEADFIIASERGNGISFPYMPSSDIQDETLAVARALRDFRLIGALPALNGKHYFVFAKASAEAGTDRRYPDRSSAVRSTACGGASLNETREFSRLPANDDR